MPRRQPPEFECLRRRPEPDASRRRAAPPDHHQARRARLRLPLRLRLCGRRRPRFVARRADARNSVAPHGRVRRARRRHARIGSARCRRGLYGRGWMARDPEPPARTGLSRACGTRAARGGAPDAARLIRARIRPAVPGRSAGPRLRCRAAAPDRRTVRTAAGRARAERSAVDPRLPVSRLRSAVDPQRRARGSRTRHRIAAAARGVSRAGADGRAVCERMIVSPRFT